MSEESKFDAEKRIGKARNARVASTAKTADVEALGSAIEQGWFPQAAGPTACWEMAMDVLLSKASAAEKLAYIDLMCNGLEKKGTPSGRTYEPMSIDSLKDQNGSTLFMIASTYTPQSSEQLIKDNEFEPFLRGLTKLGANTDAQNKDGMTALYLNAHIGNKRNLTTLLKIGCDRTIKSNTGVLPEQEAEFHGFHEAQDIIRNAPATARPINNKPRSERI